MNQPQMPQVTITLPADACQHLLAVLDEQPGKMHVYNIAQAIRVQAQNQLNALAQQEQAAQVAAEAGESKQSEAPANRQARRVAAAKAKKAATAAD